MRLLEIKSIIYDNWRLPNEQELRKELLLKLGKPNYYQQLGISANCWDSWRNITSAVKQGTVIRIPYTKYNTVERLVGGNTLQSLRDMSMHYHSGPRDPFRIAKGFIDNDAIPMAMIIKSGDRLVLTAGNTRLNSAKICNITPYPKVLIIPAVVNKLTENVDDIIPLEDKQDALKVLKALSKYYHINWGTLTIKDAFNTALNNARIEELNINELEVHHDWGRRPDSNSPIIIAHFSDDNYVVLDGQHRLIVARENGKKTIYSMVLNFSIPLNI